MKINRMAIEAVVVAMLLVVTALHGLATASSPAPPISGQPPDSTTVERLTRDRFNVTQSRLSPSLGVTETAAILAGELLLTPIDYLVDLPLVMK